jgi:serine/threonine protein kinase
MAVVGWHANTVPFVGACWTPPNECLLTEYMPNGTVERVLVRERQFGREEDLPRVLQMALDAARGVLHLHKEGVVHGDIATRNLFLDRDHRVRVGDFGLARLAAAATAATAAGGSGAVGPLKWMAPESVRMRALSEKSDVWMFGVALWEMFARGEPFPELAPLAAAAFVAKGGRLPLPNSAQPNPLFPQRIAALIARCWAERPDERPDMSAVVNELAAARDATQRSFGRMQPAPSMSASPSHGPQPSVYDRVPSLEFLQDKEYAGPEAQRRASQAQAQAQAQPQPQPQPQVQPPRTAPA